MPRLLLSGFNLDRQHRWAAILPALPRGQAGVLPPATLATKCGVYCYTGFVLVAPVDRGEVGLTRRARCLAQGRSVGGSAGAAPIPPRLNRAIPAVICLGQPGASDEPPLPIMHSAYNSLHSASDSRSLGLRVQNGRIRSAFYLGRDVSCGSPPDGSPALPKVRFPPNSAPHRHFAEGVFFGW
jgi:hypothetical protein